jgi:hypothetical protein
MPKINADWVQVILDAGEPTTGWSVEMHLRTAASASPAIAKFSTGAGTLLVGQATESGATHGIAVNATKAQMNFAAGTYLFDIIRTDGGRNTDLLDGDIIQWSFIDPITVQGLS